MVERIDGMGNELERYSKEVEFHEDKLLECLAQVGLGSQYSFDIPIPEEDSPLARLFVALRIASEHMSTVESDREQKTRELEDKIRTIEQQSQAILELSTPVIEVWDDILILPLIGTIDTQRAQQIIENLLDAIVKSQAVVAIMDITGVPVVDTKVADHLLKSIEAARMLGTDVILTGVSPHNAQTLVKLGVDLSKIVTKSSLRAGLQLAFQTTKNRVIKEQ